MGELTWLPTETCPELRFSVLEAAAISSPSELASQQL